MSGRVPSRRALLAGTVGLVVTGLPAAQAQQAAAKLRVVVVGGHPGDAEYGCGGTIARYTEQGHHVTIVHLNRGEFLTPEEAGCPEKHPEQGSEVRVQEAITAATVLGAEARFAGHCNGHAVVDRPHYDAFTALMQELAPDVLLNQWPIDNHPDHRAISSMAYEAWIRMGRRAACYYYEVSDGEDTQMFAPTDYVDITATEPRKRQACYAHATQSPDHYYALQSAVTRFRGTEAGVDQAEGFVRHIQSRRYLLP